MVGNKRKEGKRGYYGGKLGVWRKRKVQESAKTDKYGGNGGGKIRGGN